MRMKGDFEDFIDIDPNYKFKKNQRIQITNAQVPITHILNNEEIYVKNEKEATKYIMEKIVEKGDRDIYSYRNYMNNCKNKSKKTFSISFQLNLIIQLNLVLLIFLVKEIKMIQINLN